MNMKGLERHDPVERSIAQAIHAIERQHEERRRSEHPLKDQQRREFQTLLNGLARSIFDGVARAATSGRQEFQPATIPEFRSGCEHVFGLGPGVFDPDLFNEWLRARDLSHMLTADQGVVRW